MHQRLKERLVGAAVLVVIAVIFIPMLLTGPIDSGTITKTNIPDRPTEKFNSKLVPVTDSLRIDTENNETTSVDNSTDGVIDESSIDTGVAKDTHVKSKVESAEKPPVKMVNNDSKVVDKKIGRKKDIEAKQVGLTAWVVQLGYFSSKLNADKLNLKLRKSGFPAFVEPISQKGETSYRVRVGPEILRADADALLKKIKSKMKLDGIVLNYP